MDGFRVDPAQLRSAARGIGEAAGRDDENRLDDLVGDAAAYGHDRLHAAMTSFCGAWDEAHGKLRQRAADAGGALDSSAGVYEEQEARGRVAFDPRQGY
jgi:hypothetical protein